MAIEQGGQPCDSNVIGDQIGQAVRKTLQPKWLRELEILFPTDLQGPQSDRNFAIQMAGRFYLRFYGGKEGYTAVEFESLGEKFIVGKSNENDPNKIILWKNKVRWAKSRVRNPRDRYYFEAGWINFFQDDISTAEQKVIKSENPPTD